MRVNRFFVNKPLGEETFTDDVYLVHQIKNVLRLAIGDSLILFNGKDFFDFLYEIKELRKDSVHLCLLEKKTTIRRGGKVVVFLSLIKKELFELAVLKMTELGVTHIVPLISERTQPHFLNYDRLEKIAREGAEQSGRGDIPLILAERKLSACVSLQEELEVPTANTFALSLLGENPLRNFGNYDPHESIAFFIGPEGGWTPLEEISFIEKQITPLSVSPQVLRTETAAIICVYLSFLLRK